MSLWGQGPPYWVGVQRKDVGVKREKLGYSESFSSNPVLLALCKVAFIAKTSTTRQAMTMTYPLSGT